MKKITKKLTLFIVIISIIFLNSISLFAHSGRTDRNGGHKDNNNKSGLGNYHYHCGGYPAHLHTNGVCPYSSESSTTTSAESTTSTVTTSPVPQVAESPKPQIIEAESVTIQNVETKMKIGETKKLVGKVLPETTNDKSLTWTSSNTKVITIENTGDIIAVGNGKSTITAKTQNGKIASIEFEVIDEKKEEVSGIISENSNSTISDRKDTSSGNAIIGVATIGAISGGGYYLYKKNKKK